MAELDNLEVWECVEREYGSRLSHNKQLIIEELYRDLVDARDALREALIAYQTWYDNLEGRSGEFSDEKVDHYLVARNAPK